MVEKIKSLANQYLQRDIDLRDFQEKFALLYAQCRVSRTSSPLLGRIIGPLAEFSRGDRSESSFREELTKAIGLGISRV